jgi:hypothetical protein
MSMDAQIGLAGLIFLVLSFVLGYIVAIVIGVIKK